MSVRDRRFDDRHPGTGLRARIDGREVEVLDVSIGGMKLARDEGIPYHVQNRFAFELVSTQWPEMKPVTGKAVVRAAGHDWVAVQFLRPNYDLMKCVSRHVGTLLWGQRPYGY